MRPVGEIAGLVVALGVFCFQVDAFGVHPHARDYRRRSYTKRCCGALASPMRKEDKPRPKLIIFDLDGCLWRPEMYELIHFMGNKGAPFRQSEQDRNVLLTDGNQPVHLLKDVREVMRELYTESKWKNIPVGISSRTDAPHWAQELLKKFVVTLERGGEEFALADVIQGPIEMSYDSKVKHFHRIFRQTNIAFEDMIFFDNEYGNCEAVASLGVTVGYCPGGVCKGIWEKTLEEFSSSRQGIVVELD